jgi:hypothetical protein
MRSRQRDHPSWFGLLLLARVNLTMPARDLVGGVFGTRSS